MFAGLNKRPGSRCIRQAMAVAAASLLGAGCQRYEKIVGANTPFDGLPGAVGPKVERDEQDAASVAAVQIAPIRQELDDGTVILRARNPRDVMVHVYETLSREEPELFLEQVLSRKTIARFYEGGYEPTEAYERLHARFPDIRALFNRMPAGKLSPNTRFENIGANTFRLSVRGKARRGLRWTSMDVIIEPVEAPDASDPGLRQTTWKLLWFGTR